MARIRVLLNDEEMQRVCAIVENQKAIYQPERDPMFDVQRWERSKLLDIGGKFAVAKHFNVPVNITDDGRVFGPRLPSGPVLVRTMAKEWGDLILHNSDKDYRLFVLVHGKGNEFNLLGWIRGSEGKRMDYWKDPTMTRAAYFVPQTALREIGDLVTPVAQRSIA